MIPNKIQCWCNYPQNNSKIFFQVRGAKSLLNLRAALLHLLKRQKIQVQMVILYGSWALGAMKKKLSYVPGIS